MEMKTAAGINNGETNGSADNEQNDQQASGESRQIEKGLGYGDPGERSGESVPANDESISPNTGELEEDRAASLPGATAGETVSGNDSENAGAGIDYGGTGDDAGAITESTEEESGD